MSKSYIVIPRNRPYSKLSTRQKRACRIAQRDGGWFCHYCGKPLMPQDDNRAFIERYANEKFSTFATITTDVADCGDIDHVIPRCAGGTDDLDNLVLACSDCNQAKGGKSYQEFVGGES